MKDLIIRTTLNFKGINTVTIRQSFNEKMTAECKDISLAVYINEHYIECVYCNEHQVHLYREDLINKYTRLFKYINIA